MVITPFFVGDFVMELYTIGPLFASSQEALKAFSEQGFTIHSFSTLEEALAALQTAKQAPALVLIDESQGRTDAALLRKAVMQLISHSAFTYVSALSSMDPEVYHDAMEGLGMLSCLPMPASYDDGKKLLQELGNFIPLA